MKLIGTTPGLVTLLVICLTWTGCDSLQTYNSFAGDAFLYGDASGSPEFRLAKLVMRNECARCHSIFLSYSEEDWINEGYIDPGNPDASFLYSKIRGAGVGGEEDMPPSGVVSPSDLQAISDWITSVSP